MCLKEERIHQTLYCSLLLGLYTLVFVSPLMGFSWVQPLNVKNVSSQCKRFVGGMRTRINKNQGLGIWKLIL